MSDPSLKIHEITQKQNQEFCKRLSPRNLKEAKFIIAKYDLSHSLTVLTNDCLDDLTAFRNATMKYLKDREDFLMFMSKYL
jgi:hypothetical protein